MLTGLRVGRGGGLLNIIPLSKILTINGSHFHLRKVRRISKKSIFPTIESSTLSFVEHIDFYKFNINLHTAFKFCSILENKNNMKQQNIGPTNLQLLRIGKNILKLSKYPLTVGKNIQKW